MKRKSRWLLVALSPFLVGCPGGGIVQPQNVTAIATISGLDGLGHPTSATLTLTHNPSQAPTARLESRMLTVNSVKNFEVAVARTGIPIVESYVLLSIARASEAPGSSAPQPTIVSGDPTYLASNVGNLVKLEVDTRRLDSPLTAALNNAFPSRHRTGFALFARWSQDSPHMPFSDTSATIDVSRFATAVFNALSTAVTNADADSSLFSLGGAQNDGNFEMYFVPYVEHASLASAGVPANGFTLIFKAAIKAGTVAADVYVPMSVEFFVLPSGNGNANLDARLDLIDFGSDSEDKTRLTISADGAFSTQIGNEIRTQILNAVTNLPAENRQSLQTALGLFSALVNSIRPNAGQGPISTRTRVVLIPDAVGPNAFNRILPASRGVPVSLYILD
ncbi:MAG: hypothetical protein JSS66_03355 [Armatimonadetes bacterium]|nr:hypothetical protein [Armatimonadota bacterium]